MQDVAWKTCRKRWTIETGSEAGPGRYLQENDMVISRKMDLALNNLQGLICHKIKPNQIIYI